MESALSEISVKSDKKLVATGIFWNVVQMVVNQGFAFVVKLILAKLLFPEQFGLIGMASVFIGIIQVLNDLGFGAALIHRREDDLRAEHYYTTFWTGIIWSVFLFLLLSLAIAPFAATFYNQPELSRIIPVLSISILFTPMILINKAILTKKMNFKKIAFIDNTANVVSGILAVTLAFAGAGVWALVFNSLFTFFISMPQFFSATSWTPKFVWEKKAFADIFGFGAYTTGSNIFNYLYNNIDYLLIGKLLGVASLGMYTLAFVLTDTFRTKIMSVINTVMFPVYSKRQNDLSSLRKYYLKVIEFNCLMIFPIMVFFITLAPAFVTGFFGKQWSGTAMPLQILSVAVIFHSMVNGNTALLRGIGLPGLEMKQQILKTLIFIPTLVVGIKMNGIIGATIAVLINKIVVFLIAHYTFRKLINIRISLYDFFIALKAPIIASGVSLVVATTMNNAGVDYIVVAVALFLVYGIVTWLLIGKELVELVGGLRKRKN